MDPENGDEFMDDNGVGTSTDEQGMEHGDEKSLLDKLSKTTKTELATVWRQFAQLENQRHADAQLTLELKASQLEMSQKIDALQRKFAKEAKESEQLATEEEKKRWDVEKAREMEEALKKRDEEWRRKMEEEKKRWEEEKEEEKRKDEEEKEKRKDKEEKEKRKDKEEKEEEKRKDEEEKEKRKDEERRRKTEERQRQLSQGEKILKQVEYYFGDINLLGDKFLQEELKKDDGWIPLNTMLKFNRLAALTTDLELITAALKDSQLIDLSDDGTKIRRNPEVPLPENTVEYWTQIKHRSVYMNGFPQDSTLDAIAEFVGQFGDVLNILMRKTKGSVDTPKVFKGSVFVTFVDQDQAKQLVDKKGLKFKDQHDIEAKMQEAYWADKNVERHARRELKKQERREAIEQQTKAHYVKGMVLKLNGLPTGEEQRVLVNKLKQFFKPYGVPAYVMIQGAEATIRFGGNVENAAQETWQKAVMASGDSKVLMDGSELSAVVLEGEEEARYWTEFSKARMAKVQGVQQRKERRRERKVQQQQMARETRKRAANRVNDDDDHQQEGKKAKRIVFNDDDEEEEGR